ncbi:Transposon Tf2-6 polyprotein [Dictyocoela muelleri]|nr:Transposon Tf2-6 polyprotein [Dictyocoela muelleri]
MHFFIKKKKGKKFSWNIEDQQKLENILKKIQKKPIIYFHDYNIPFILVTDFSDVGFGSRLGQRNNNIGFYSQKLTESEQNYTVISKEIMSIIKSLDANRKII